MSKVAPIDVLVVDDVNACRQLLRSCITQLHASQEVSIDRVRFHHAENGLMALEVIDKIMRVEKELGTDNTSNLLVFLDIDMPEQDGLMTLEQLKKRFPELFTVMVSGHTTIDNIRGALESGANGFIAKPFNLEKIKEALLKFIKGRGEA